MKPSRMDYEETYRDGEVIVREGDETREMYVIQSGEVVATKKMEGREMALVRLGRGKFFGEMSLLESMPRSATIRAVGDTKLLVIKPGSLLLKIRRNPTFAFEMLQHMSKRIRNTTEQLKKLTIRCSDSDDTHQQLNQVQISSEFFVEPEDIG